MDTGGAGRQDFFSVQSKDIQSLSWSYWCQLLCTGLEGHRMTQVGRDSGCQSILPSLLPKVGPATGQSAQCFVWSGLG